MSADEISPDAITGVSCDEMAEGRTLAIEVGDEVVVARITQLQTGEFACPVEGCVRRFDSRKGRSTHLGKLHPEYDRRKECPECGERYEPTHADQIYCSRDCYHASGQTTLDCDWCGEEFVVKESHADGKRFCSQECYDEYNEVRTSKEERACEACGDTFEVYPSQQQQYCSRQCAGIGRRKEPVEKECPTCGDTFETYPSNDCTYCSRECFYEARRDRDTNYCSFCGRKMELAPSDDSEYCSRACYYEDHRDRPESLYGTIRDIIAQDYTHASTIGRIRSHLGADATEYEAVVAWALYTTDTFHAAAERIDDAVEDDVDASELWPSAVEVAKSVFGISTRAPVGEVLPAADECRTWTEVAQELRFSRTLTKKFLTFLGIDQEVNRETTKQDIFDRARDELVDEVETERRSGVDAYRAEVTL